MNIIKEKGTPWENEPDFVEFVDEETGYNCFIWRHPRLRHLCGYVELPKEHKLYGKDYWKETVFDEIDVHGGVISAGFGWNTDERYMVAFDCAHTGDFILGTYMFFPTNIKDIYRNTNVYRNIEYVKNECKKLAKQLKELE